MGTDFEAVRDDYERLREAERLKLADCLSEHDGIQSRGIAVKTGGRSGKGRTNYTSGGRISGYNLRNWKWVELYTNNGFECIVSLNMPDIDPKSGYTHILFDRIGIYITYHRDKLYFKTEIYTDIDLPLNAEDMERIAALILEQFDRFSV